MKRALVLGDAACVYDDAAEAMKLFTPDAVFATNNIGTAWKGDVDFWCTLHPGPCSDWIGIAAALEKRVEAGFNRPEVWGHQSRGGIQNRSSDWGGSTGLLAVKVAREKCFDRIVLAGVPMTEAGAHFYDETHKWEGCRKFHRAWSRRLEMLGPFVRSMSGWTRELFGEPTLDWFEAPPVRTEADPACA